MLDQLVEQIKEISGNSILYFDTAVEIKLSPHQDPICLWAVATDYRNKLHVMDHNEQWFDVEAKDEKIIQSLYQRVSVIHKMAS